MTRTAVTIRCKGLLPAIAFLALYATEGYAQQQAQERPVSFALGLGGVAKPGWGAAPLAQGTLEFGTRWQDLGVRFDGAFAGRFANVPGRRLTILTGDLVYSRRIGFLAPYVLGGIGEYAESGVGTAFGLNAGLGIKGSVWRLRPFVEARDYLATNKTVRATALTIGLRF